MKRWPKEVAVSWNFTIDQMFARAFDQPMPDERIYVLQPLPKKRKRRKAGKSK